MIDSQLIKLHAWLLDNVLLDLAHIDFGTTRYPPMLCVIAEYLAQCKLEREWSNLLSVCKPGKVLILLCSIDQCKKVMSGLRSLKKDRKINPQLFLGILYTTFHNNQVQIKKKKTLILLLTPWKHENKESLLRVRLKAIQLSTGWYDFSP